jgi:hypothetical protein
MFKIILAIKILCLQTGLLLKKYLLFAFYLINKKFIHSKLKKIYQVL